MRSALLIALLLVGHQTPTTQTPPAPSQPEPSANYVVGAQDVLNVTVFNEEKLSGRFRVENDGRFDYPFVGRLQAGGATVPEIAALIRTKLAEGYVRDPQVTVEVEVFRSQNVFVMGEVRAPGKYTLTGAVTLIAALAQAGSTTPTAGTEVLILHPKRPGDVSSATPDTPDANVDRINLHDLQTGNLAANVTVHDGDTIFVLKAQRIFITGYVHNPGVYMFEPNLTVLQAISMAGGVTELGSETRIRIVRNNKQLDVKPTERVQPEDTIIVRKRIL